MDESYPHNSINYVLNESEISKTEIDIISNDTEFETAVIEDFYHHEAHALSACMMSPYDECAVLTCDGRGDYVSLTFYYFNKHSNTLQKLYSSNTVGSLGFFYGRITGLLGYTPGWYDKTTDSVQN